MAGSQDYLTTVPGLRLLTSGVCYLCTLALLPNWDQRNTLFEPEKPRDNRIYDNRTLHQVHKTKLTNKTG